MISLQISNRHPTVNPLVQNGYEIHRDVFSDGEIELLRHEADRIAAEAGSACVRHLRDRSNILRELSLKPKIFGILPEHDFRPVRSILFDKTPSENWPVAWHQDLTICTAREVACDGYGPWSVKDGIPHVQPPAKLLESMVTVRIHLDQTDSENGALLVMPRSHIHGRLSHSAIAEISSDPAHICECQPGDVLLMSPLILHSSRRSAIPSRRRIIHFEYAPSDILDTRLSWHETH